MSSVFAPGSTYARIGIRGLHACRLCPQGRSNLPLAVTVCRIYNTNIRLVWSEAKRRRNLIDHGFDFVDAADVFEGATFTFEDDRFAYGESRFVTLGLLAGIPVSIAHTETPHEIRIISFRKATSREAGIFVAGFQN